jgi:acetylornithine deacetylase/succinyl-diaminopimelate desuccinylase-like protein
MGDINKTRSFIERLWHKTDGKALHALMESVKITNLSPEFDSVWADNGLLDEVAELHAANVKALLDDFSEQGIKTGDINITLLGSRDNPVLDGDSRRTPLLLIELPAFGGYDGDETVLMYGHMDKQPGMEPWSEGLHPFKPVIRGDSLYGRGTADDGYALYAELSAVMAVREQGLKHSRVVIIIEANEESGEADISRYLSELESFLGNVSLIFILDAGGYDFSRLWITNSLRGTVSGILRTEVLTNAVHSGV